MAGFIKIDRDILALCKPEKPHKYTEREAIYWLVENAAYGSYEHGVYGLVQAGDIPFNMRYLRKAWGWQHRDVKSLLDRLQKAGFLEVKSEPENEPAFEPKMNQITIRLISVKESYRTKSEAENEPKVKPNKEEDKEEDIINKRKNIKKEKDFQIPDWVDAEAWDGFLKMRKANKIPNTERALSQIVKKLDEYRSRGDPPAEVLDQSTMNNWRGVFPLNRRSQNGKNQNNGGNIGYKQPATWASEGDRIISKLLENPDEPYTPSYAHLLKPS